MPETEEEFELSAGGKVAIGLTFPVWIPLAIALAVIAVPAFIGWVVFEVMGGDMIHANIEKRDVQNEQGYSQEVFFIN